MKFFHHLKADQIHSNELTADLGHIPETVQRQRYVLSHLLSGPSRKFFEQIDTELIPTQSISAIR